jgi:hypothetical protein
MKRDPPNWDQIVRELKAMPPVDPAAPGRIVQEIRGRERRGWGAVARGWLLRKRRVMVAPLPAMVGAAAVIVVLAVLLRGAGPSPGEAGPEASSFGKHPTQFMVVAQEATRVAVVGDFNGWDPTTHPLEQVSPGVWSAVVPLEPGRHTYAYVVDGEQWIPDSLAARAPEDEFGGRNSVLLVAEGL